MCQSPSSCPNGRSVSPSPATFFVIMATASYLDRSPIHQATFDRSTWPPTSSFITINVFFVRGNAPEKRGMDIPVPRWHMPRCVDDDTHGTQSGRALLA